MVNPRSDHAHSGAPPSPAVVAVAGWLVPGGGYWLIGERARGVIVGVTVVALFVMGMLVGGVRVIQVPGYGEGGGRLYTWIEVRGPEDRVKPTGRIKVDEQPPYDNFVQGSWVATDVGALLRDVGNKPWSICQILAGPVGIAGGAWSIAASRPAGDDGAGGPAGVLSHSRINEIAVLYTAVAGMLNLLVIIDAASRAARGDMPARAADGATPGASQTPGKVSRSPSVEAA